jgi:hypothetical protein
LTPLTRVMKAKRRIGQSVVRDPMLPVIGRYLHPASTTLHIQLYDFLQFSAYTADEKNIKEEMNSIAVILL